MKVLIYIVVFVISYLFGSFAFPQLVGSARMIIKKNTTPYVFTLVLWSFIYIVISFLICFLLPKYFAVYIVAHIIPLALTLRTKNIE